MVQTKNKELILMNNEQFLNYVADLIKDTVLCFCQTRDEKDHTYGECWYSIKKTEFEDVRIILIGGNMQRTICIDYDDADSGEGDILDFIADDIIEYLNDEGFSNEIYVESDYD